MDSKELGDKLKDLFSKGAQASKQALEKAGNTVQEFSDKSVTKFEIKQIETKIDSVYKKIGREVFLQKDKDIQLQFNSEQAKTQLEQYFSELEELNKKLAEKV